MELSATIHLLGDLLGQVLTELEGHELFAVEERVRALAKTRRAGDEAAGARLADEVAALDAGAARAIAAAFTLYFDLVNLGRGGASRPGPPAAGTRAPPGAHRSPTLIVTRHHVPLLSRVCDLVPESVDAAPRSALW